MNKLRLAIAALSIFALAGLTACDNDNNAAQPAEKKSVAPKKKDGDKEKPKAEKTAEQLLLERDANAQKALNIMKNQGDEVPASDCEYDELYKDIIGVTIPYSPTGEYTKALDIMTVIQDENSDAGEFAYSVNAAASRTDKNSNKFCMIKMAGVISSFTLNNHKKTGVSKDIEGLIKAYESRIERLESVVTALKPRFDSAMTDPKVQGRLALYSHEKSVATIKDAVKGLESQVEAFENLDCSGACEGKYGYHIPAYAKMLSKEAERFSKFADTQLDGPQRAARASQAKSVADEATALFDSSVDMLESIQNEISSQ